MFVDYPTTDTLLRRLQPKLLRDGCFFFIRRDPSITRLDHLRRHPPDDRVPRHVRVVLITQAIRPHDAEVRQKSALAYGGPIADPDIIPDRYSGGLLEVPAGSDFPDVVKISIEQLAFPGDTCPVADIDPVVADDLHQAADEELFADRKPPIATHIDRHASRKVAPPLESQYTVDAQVCYVSARYEHVIGEKPDPDKPMPNGALEYDLPFQTNESRVSRAVHWHLYRSTQRKHAEVEIQSLDKSPEPHSRKDCHISLQSLHDLFRAPVTLLVNMGRQRTAAACLPAALRRAPLAAPRPCVDSRLW
jgi:hypothetical protein